MFGAIMKAWLGLCHLIYILPLGREGKCIVATKEEVLFQEFMKWKEAKAKVVAEKPTVNAVNNYEVYRKGDKLVVEIDLTEGGDTLTKSEKGVHVCNTRIRPISFDLEGNPRIHGTGFKDWTGAWGSFSCLLTRSINESPIVKGE